MSQEKTAQEKAQEEAEEERKKRFETLCGLLLATFAAILAVTDLYAGKFGDDELTAHIDKGSAFSWYQSKGTKKASYEGVKIFVEEQLKLNVYQNEEQKKAAEESVQRLEKKIQKYEKEQNEILKGSTAVGQENWVQETFIDGKPEMGKVTGAEEYGATADKLGEAGDVFDFATLFLQICLVMGAISIVLQQEKMKWAFLFVMISLGTIGSIYSARALMLAFSL
jgi:hypothetical protein